MKRLLISLALLLVAAASLSAEDKTVPNFKFYGFVRNYFTFDTRVSTAGTEDFYYWMPKDVKMVNGADINDVCSFRFAAITTRLGVDISGYEFSGYKIGGKIEADFYAGLTGVTGTAQLRLRQAFATVAKDGRSWKIGQAWHPMAADLPDIFSLESGAPFGPFSRTPLVQFDWKFADALSLTTAAIWQMQYTSTGPEGASANYIKYGCTPELYLGLNYKKDKTTLRLGADLLSIMPRQVNNVKMRKDNVFRLDADRITTWNVFLYGASSIGKMDLKAKLTYANDGSHFNLIGGYGVKAIDDTYGYWTYAATRNATGWATLSYKGLGRWVPSMLLGYSKLFGTPVDVLGNKNDDGTYIYRWVKNSADVVDYLFRVQPEVIYNLGKLQFGLEYMLTGANYGKPDARMHAVDGLHLVLNHRVQMLVKLNF
ncbi:MAG: hypothetical protein J5737_06900 [Bacteroidales bacterium]|nr:hypothetical protein [Bacteroidales bacterium]